MKYYCETCGKTFNSEDKCLECERIHKDEIAKQECLKKEQASRREEVEAAYNKYQELREKYAKDYNISSIPTVYPVTFECLLGNLVDTFLKNN